MRARVISTAFLCLAMAFSGTALAGPVAVTVSIEVAPTAFSPNGDGRSDAVTATVTLDAPATLDVEVLASDLTVVRLLAADLAGDAGSTGFSWDGLDDESARVPDGPYLIRVTADSGAGATVASTAVRVDTKAPRFRWRGIVPEPLTTTRPFHMRFLARDAATDLQATTVLFDASGEVRRSKAASVSTGLVSLEERPRYPNGAPWIPGLYLARVLLIDDAGNRTQSPLRAFRNHRAVTTRVIHRLGGTGPRVALTFDDCGDGAAWRKILKILHDRHVQASFFCLSPSVTRYRAQARRTVADGHTIGSHSINHALETQMSYSQIVRQNRGPQKAWWKVAHITPAPYFRPPYGAYNSEVLRAVGAVGYARTVIWDVDPRDWESPGPAAIADRVLSHARAGSIVVMHTLDGTAAALPSIIGRLRKRGLEPVSLQELFDRTGMRNPADAGPVLAHPFE